MFYKFNAYGHPNIQGTHKTTLEFTKDGEVSLKGNCIVGVKADFELEKIKKFIKNYKNKRITIKIKTISKYKKMQAIIEAELNPDFNSNKEFVIRKTNFVSDRTFAIKADNASFNLNKGLINFLKEKKNKISVIIKDKQ